MWMEFGGNSEFQDSLETIFQIETVQLRQGKSQLLTRYTKNDFQLSSKPTIGVELAHEDIEIDGRVIRAQIWDTAGQERYRAITSAYYRGALGAIIVYDITNAKSYENVGLWIEELRQHTDDKVVLMLVGNKVDLLHLRAVEKKTAADFASEHSMHFVETSALNALNVDVAFESTLRKIYEIIREQENDRNELINEKASMLRKKMNKKNKDGSVDLNEDTNGEKGRPPCCLSN
ncbi:ras-related protein RABA2a-like [Xenia sp. Carnegie-2017]|uniref:ras-related protein RABA2a-like n=1 Tax=Xenia sp. Carnegie-2017 TaxID=2897299 RepID=UPI001F044F2C|nr:ras-related protein RABA2a-like [Xenia sp. Carnegie-2017]